MDQERREGIEREFRYALQTLAAGAPDQIRVLSPGCIACELLNDFDLAAKDYRNTFPENPAQQQIHDVERVDRLIDALPEADVECFNNDVLTRPAWHQVRAAAKETLAAFGWPDGSPPESTETAPGVWRRPP